MSRRYKLEKPDEVKQVDDLDLVRMTRCEVLDKYGVSAMHYRERVICEQALPAEVLAKVLRRALELPECVRKGRLVWEKILPLLPFQPHGLDRWDLRWAAEENLRTEEQVYEVSGGVWWWWLRVAHGIADPTAWVVEQAEKRERGWARRLLEMAFGEAEKQRPPGVAYQLVKRCRRYLERRKERQ